LAAERATSPAGRSHQAFTGESILKAAGVEAGLTVHVGTTDGALEAELTNDGRMLVQGLSLSDAATARARNRLFEDP
jgi:hypothetical protein